MSQVLEAICLKVSFLRGVSVPAVGVVVVLIQMAPAETIDLWAPALPGKREAGMPTDTIYLRYNLKSPHAFFVSGIEQRPCYGKRIRGFPKTGAIISHWAACC